ncbi:Palmitoyltransferase zdhhc16 [Chytridiales sp. JEL 0842]|nr:Palmitoyltransferase zdhhc16 [Chytridiales sp. JEL 0842]
MKILWGSVLRSLEATVGRIVVWVSPLFVVAAIALISLCAYVFFAITVPYYFDQADSPTTPLGLIGKAFNLILAAYLLIQILFNYAMAVTTDPGKANEHSHAPILPSEQSLRGDPDRPPESTAPAAAGNNDEAAGDSAAIPLLERQQFTRPKVATCTKCRYPKPTRAHHCSVCKRCILKMDHHCPWINNCVGHHNHRYFLIFMLNLTVACVYFFLMNVYLAWEVLWRQIDYNWSEPFMMNVFLFTVLLTLGIAFAVGGLAGWHTYLVLTGQTTIECYINKSLRYMAQSRGEYFINEYDLGPRRNVAIFFNACRKYPWWYALLPLKVPALGDGTRYLTASGMLSSRKDTWLDGSDFQEHADFV